jgi:leucyl aminopeptidase
MAVPIVGTFADRLPETLTRNAAARIQEFSAQVGERLVVDDTPPTVYVGLGACTGWTPERGHRALSALAGLRINAADCETTGLIDALSTVTDEASARELVDTALALHLEGESPPPSVGATVAAAVTRAQQWTNADAGTLNPPAFVAEARRVAQESGLSCDVLQGEDLRDQGFGAIFGMGSGSPHPPALIDLRYRPANPTSSVTLVGKGVTFDTGGLSIKGAAAMAGMRQDKCGAATVLAVMSVLRDLEVNVEVRALLPVIENMIGPRSLRPGDVVTAWGGTRIHVVDTDFEGRVILADALAYAGAEGPDLIVDVATLTYQVVVALGPDIGGLFTRDDETAAMLMASGEAAGEPLWRLPYDERYLNQVLMPDGVKNHPETDSGRAITAALFLGRFVPEVTPWAHLDITGPAWRGPASSPGATGFGVRTLLSLLRSL